MQLMILGMYGSSTLCQVLLEMGVYHRLENVDLGENNPKELYERKDISALNHEMIRASGADWDMVSDFAVENIPNREKFESRIRDILSELDTHKPWMISDAGLSLLFPVWREFLETPICIHIIGSPKVPARFLDLGRDSTVSLNLALWEKYNLSAFTASAGLPRITVFYQGLITNPVKTVATLYESLCALGVEGLHLPSKQEILAITKNAENFLEKQKDKIRLDNYMNADQKHLHKMLREGSLLACEVAELPSLSAGAEEILRQHETHKRTLEITKTQYYNMGRALWKNKDSDVVKLRQWVETLGEDISATFNSLTWKTGAGLTGILRKLLFIKSPTAREHIEETFEEFRQWKITAKQSREQTKFIPKYLVEKWQAITSFYNFAEGGSIPRWPLEIFLEVSNVCDLKCAMCNTFSAFNPGRLFSIKKEERGFFSEYTALDSLLQHSLRVHCFGYGEPTIHPEFKEIISYISDYEVLIDFFSNGMHLTEELCEFLVEKKVYRVVLSFSGTNKEEYENIYIGGNYEKVLTGISRLARIKAKQKTNFPKIEINCMGFQHQLDKIVEFVDLMADHGVNIIFLKPVTGFANIPQLHAHIAIMRPWVEGKLLEKAEIRAQERGLSFNATPFINATKVATEEEVEVRRQGRIIYAKQDDAANSFVPIDQLRIEADKIVPDKPPIEPRGSKIQAINTTYPKTKEAMQDSLDIRAPKSALDIPCCEPFKTFYVQKSGSVKPCCFGLKNTDSLLGNVNQSSAEEIWRGMGFQTVQEAVLNGQYPMKICGKCVAHSLYPKDHYVEHLMRAYTKWFEEAFGQTFDQKLLKKALELAGSKEIIDKKR